MSKTSSQGTTRLADGTETNYGETFAKAIDAARRKVSRMSEDAGPGDYAPIKDNKSKLLSEKIYRSIMVVTHRSLSEETPTVELDVLHP